MNIVFIGPAGSGKGTQAVKLSERLNLTHISTGQLLRDEAKKGTELGKKIALYIEKGDMIPNDMMIDILKDRLSKGYCNKGFILDGYPRNLEQGKMLYEVLKEMGKKVDYIFNITLSRDVAMKRILGRFACKKCGTVYNKYFSPTKVEGKCDVCGSHECELRKDDASEDSINKRLDLYEKITVPLIEFYSKKGLLYSIDGVNTVDNISSEIDKALGID